MRPGRKRVKRSRFLNRRPDRAVPCCRSGRPHGCQTSRAMIGEAGTTPPRPAQRRPKMAQNRLLDDFARLFTDAAGMAQGVRREAEGVVKAQFERLIRDMDVVSREEFEAVREMAILAREQNERLEARITAL